jgi:hypothetical protein
MNKINYFMFNINFRMFIMHLTIVNMDLPGIGPQSPNQNRQMAANKGEKSGGGWDWIMC